MKFNFAKLSAVKAGAIVVFAVQGPGLTKSAQQLDKTCKGALSRALKASRFHGDIAEIIEVLAPQGLRCSRVLVVGLGSAGKAGHADFERIGGQIVAKLQSSGETVVSVIMDAIGTLAITVSEAAMRLALGGRLRSYRFDKYRTKEKAAKKPSLTRFVVLTSDYKQADQLFNNQDPVIDGVFMTRDLVSEPANVLYPKNFADRIMALKDVGIEVEILGEREMRRLGFGALIGVSQGSAQEPQLAIMQWNGHAQKATPKPADKRNKTSTSASAPPVLLVGKGVTFDSGGISIKPAGGMEDMKWDMGGAGAVTGAMYALAIRRARANVVGVVALVENMPSGTAQRPGDVVRSLSGQTIEVINTDAEGRLILCDAMWYAQERFKPKVMIDLATLTGAIIISLGHEYAGMFSNNDDLCKQLSSSGFASGDKLWRMPMGDSYDGLINSPIADMKNVGPREGGSITAAQFLQRFVKPGVAWAHLDIAGMAWSSKDTALWEKGATGYGVRLLDTFIRDHHEEK